MKKPYYSDRTEMAEMLVEAGGSIYEVDSDGHTPLWHAMTNKDDDCSEYLVTQMTKLSMPEKMPNELNAEGIMRLLNEAVLNGLNWTVDALIQMLQDPTSALYDAFHHSPVSTGPIDSIMTALVHGISLLSYAGDHGYYQLCLILLERFPEMATLRDKTGETSLQTGKYVTS